jgi:hypothetical protein
MTKFRAALGLAAALILSACYPPTTSHPVGTTAGLKLDTALTGTWRGVDDDGKPSYFHFLAPSDGTQSVVIAEAGPKAEDWNYVTLTTAKLGANRFMNARMTIANGKPEGADAPAPPGTVPVLYRIDAKGVMTLSMMDETAVKAAIRAGKIKGTIEQGDMGDAVITAEPAALDKFLATPAGLALFVKPFFTVKKVE